MKFAISFLIFLSTAAQANRINGTEFIVMPGGEQLMSKYPGQLCSTLYAKADEGNEVELVCKLCFTEEQPRHNLRPGDTIRMKWTRSGGNSAISEGYSVDDRFFGEILPTGTPIAFICSSTPEKAISEPEELEMLFKGKIKFIGFKGRR